MITITRSLARRLRAVFRRAGIKPLGSYGPRVSFQAGLDGLRIHSLTADTAVQYLQPGEYPREEFAVPMDLLDACRGKRDDPVMLEARTKKKIVASWLDAGIPQRAEYDAEPIKKPFPEMPAALVDVDSAFWQALRDAAESSDPNPTRFALNNIQLRGESGLVFATDGRQIFQHGGFQFPWSEDVLIPAPAVLGSAELAADVGVEIGKTEQSLALRIGSWTVALTIDRDGRFPKLEEIIARADSGNSLLRLTPGDAEFLAAALPRLPREDATGCGVTLDLNGRAYVRAKGASNAVVTELELTNSVVAGEPIRAVMDRRYLLRALKLGFREVRLTTPDVPVLAADERRKFIWAPLSPTGAVGTAADAIKIASPPQGAERSASSTTSTRRRFTMSESTTTTLGADGVAAGNATPATAGHPASNDNGGAAAKVRTTTIRKSNRSSSTTTLDQASALRDSLRRQASQAGELVRAMKRQRREASLLRSTLASLKQLHAAG
jgi:hypothetical protein